MKVNIIFNKKKIVNNNINYYYNELVNNDIKKSIKSVYKVGYPIFYKEVYYFWLSGKILKAANKKYKLNEIIKLKSSMDKTTFLMMIPFQIPYLIF